MSAAAAADAGPAEWLLAVRAFHRQWFPSHAAIQHFWFGARKQSMRPFFERLLGDSEAALRQLARAAGLRPLGLGGAASAGLPPRAFARLQLCSAVFLDQMCRNVAAVRGDGSRGELTEACDAAAVPLALAAIAAVGGPDAGELLNLGTPAELCFLSLILRHTRQPELIQISLRLLLALEGQVQGDREALEICERFLVETRDAAQAVEVEAYLERAFTVDEPLPLRGPPDGAFPRLEVLDARCLRLVTSPCGANPPFVRALLDPTTRSSFEQHNLVKVLREALRGLGLLRPDRGIVLSLSGGVDSMVTCCLLQLLHSQLPPEERFCWCALHLCHPNRSDAVDEEGWVRWSCHQLGVQLFTYRLRIRRPHGALRTGISRERYEEKSKELRFRMYARCLAGLGVTLSDGAALVAHHQDDADENRLAELGKGNILHIDGMAMEGVMLDVKVVRPLLAVRKEELIAFAEAAGVCYMQDSTPKWSRRGWIRRLLDGLGAAGGDAAVHQRLLESLSRAGASSEALGGELDAALLGWKRQGIIPGVLKLPGPEGASSFEVVVLQLPELLELARGFEPRLQELCREFSSIAQVWNAAIDRQHGADGAPAAGSNQDAGEDCDGEGVDDAPGACPLQKIRVGDEAPGAGPFLLGRAIAAASNHSPEVQKLLKGQLSTRKALTHLWDCMGRARREYQWGTLHKRCPCLYLHAERCLLLCDLEGHERSSADQSWQRNFAMTASTYVQQLGSAALTAQS